MNKEFELTHLQLVDIDSTISLQRYLFSLRAQTVLRGIVAPCYQHHYDAVDDSGVDKYLLGLCKYVYMNVL